MVDNSENLKLLRYSCTFLFPEGVGIPPLNSGAAFLSSVPPVRGALDRTASSQAQPPVRISTATDICLTNARNRNRHFLAQGCRSCTTGALEQRDSSLTTDRFPLVALASGRLQRRHVIKRRRKCLCAA